MRDKHNFPVLTGVAHDPLLVCRVKDHCLHCVGTTVTLPTASQMANSRSLESGDSFKASEKMPSAPAAFLLGASLNALPISYLKSGGGVKVLRMTR